ncbi:hypothetical protein M3226_26170 [Neobacillus cucumis]|uniref:hypothetical protein n=1 Tax=Neobacillus cucumis TaxID=1740721 RepID=UPI00203D5CD4|nr:hypothetical protein [Neobacillus cucumis]MCM3729106.1 hypothetical protein [Neobacillus cucumis]
MPQQKLTIIPVTLHTENKDTSSKSRAVPSSPPTCAIKTGNVEISFFNSVDEHIIQTIMKELKDW